MPSAVVVISSDNEKKFFNQCYNVKHHAKKLNPINLTKQIIEQQLQLFSIKHHATDYILYFF